jgi:hypothetical protein
LLPLTGITITTSTRPESIGRWLAIEALAKPDDIVYTVLLLTPRGPMLAGKSR